MLAWIIFSSLLLPVVTIPEMQYSLVLTILLIILIVIIKILGQRQKGVIARSILFRPGGQLASELARHPVVLKVNDWVFCHGGLLPHHVSYGLERMNREVSDWMSGLNIEDEYSSLPFIATRGYDSVVWNRLYSRDVSDLDDYQVIQIQSILKKTLQTIDAKAMVVGHTPQPTGVNWYDGRYYLAMILMHMGRRENPLCMLYRKLRPLLFYESSCQFLSLFM